MAKKYDIVAVVGKYTAKDGSEKSRYLNIGVVFETDKGLSIKLESVPVGWDGWAQLYEPKEQDKGTGKPIRGGRVVDDDTSPPF